MKLVEEHRAELSTEELQELQKEQQQIVTEDISSGEEEGREEASIALIKEMYSKWLKFKTLWKSITQTKLYQAKMWTCLMKRQCPTLETF